ncbi:MAG: patatin-like protein [Proteobacteria bacterium]|nr:patatin-like protein [Pseudomonadota bacterium]
MREKELRLGVLCSGGISLAVYMHGLTKEILKLVRASKLYHAVPDSREKQSRSFPEAERDSGQTFDTEEVYYDFLQCIGGELDLRVIVDVIAGASAGGINGVLLARALAHDLRFEDLRELWLEGADVEALTVDQSPSGLSDRIFRPLVRWVAGDRLSGMEMDDEVSGKLVSMLQIARLQSPFSGERLLESLITAMEKMGNPTEAGQTLMPASHQLDMFVTLTDFFGYSQSIPLYDPPVIEEREHRHMLHFRYRLWPNGEEESDFDEACIPALAFAARATASFPALFPPAQMAEVDRVLERQGRKWDSKEKFLSTNFKVYQQSGSDPELTSFLDGAVLNNKPFGAAIEAIQKNPAFRSVDRRLVYINPNPAGRPPPPTAKPPGVLRTLKAALSDIPRNQPISDDLAWVREKNASSARIREIIEAARPDIVAVVEEITKGKLDRRHVSTGQVAQWRDLANARAGQEAGFAFKGYLRLKLGVAARGAGRIAAGLCDLPPGSARAQFVIDAIEAWAMARGAVLQGTWTPETGTLQKSPPPWVRLLRGFDLDFRRRRVRFVISGLNALYGRLGSTDFADLSAYRLDYLKTQLYEVLDGLRMREGTAPVSLEAAARARELFSQALERSDFDPKSGAAFGTNNLEQIDIVIDGLSRDLNLEVLNRRMDDIFAGMEHSGPGGAVRRLLLTEYLGFSLWDIVTFSAGTSDQAGEFDEIRVSRLSPQDCNGLRDGGPETVLKGVKMGNFGAFFKRAHRENDYLWGRLHGVDRLVDILCDAARIEGLGDAVDGAALKKKAFQRILETEREYLKESSTLIDQLEKEVAALP